MTILVTILETWFTRRTVEAINEIIKDTASQASIRWGGDEFIGVFYGLEGSYRKEVLKGYWIK